MLAGVAWSLPRYARHVQTGDEFAWNCARTQEISDAPRCARAHLERMPTPGERRALIFLASIAALGVAARGWREFHPHDAAELAGDRTALARQIEAVDSAIAVSSSKRKPREPRDPGAPRGAHAPGAQRASGASAGQEPEPSRIAAAPRTSRARSRQAAPADTLPRDPRQAYWDRSAYFDSVRIALDVRDHVARRNSRDSKAPPPTGRERASTRSGAPIDLDLAGIDELAALPMIGPALARRIVSDRVENGPFGSIAELERISGITHAFAHRLEPFVTFSRSPRHGSTGERRPQSKSERRPGGKSRP